MAPLKLNVRLSATDNLDVEVEDDETVKVLGAMIYSLKPEIGEDPRVCYKGKILNQDATLASSGVKNSDTIAAVRRPQQAVASAEGFNPPARTVEQAPQEAPAPVTSEAYSPAVPDSSADVPLPAAEASCSEVPAQQQDAPVPPADEKSCADGVDAMPEKKQRIDENLADDAASNATTAPGMVRQVSGDSQASSVFEDYTTAEGLHALARRLDNSSSSVPPERTAQALRTAAEKMQSLEGTVKELAQALYMTHTFSAHALNKLVSEGGDAPTSKPAEGDGRSFMFQKGDAETQEMHANAAAKRPTMTGGVIGGGTCSSKPTSREEMEQARKARLARLEADQAQKKKEIEDANEKSKSREAMFKQNVGPAKQLGQH